MLDRLRAGDAEGNYRRVWLLTALLEDYFVFRNRWYEGPKAAFNWLRRHRPDVCAKFASALEPDADLSAIRDLVRPRSWRSGKERGSNPGTPGRAEKRVRASSRAITPCPG